MAARVRVDVKTFVNNAVQRHAALSMSDASKCAQCCKSEKRLFHRKISKDLQIIFKQGK
jgi:L-fucose isomerase-like protein